MQNYLFTSESVTEGHPDKICDQVSDAVLDAILAKDPKARVACECSAATGLLLVMIGIASHVSLLVDTFGTGKLPDTEIIKTINKHFDLRSAAIIERFDLRRPIYTQTAAYGHFGRSDLNLPWERLDMADTLRAEF